MLYKKIFCIFFIIAVMVYGQTRKSVSNDTRQAPKLLNYQGYLTDTLGIPIDDNLDMTFTIYDQVSGGEVLWTEDTSNVPVEKGIFHTIPGSINPIPDSVFADFTSTWLEITLEGPQTLTPRTRITSSSYALYAHDADQLDGISAADFVAVAGDTMSGLLDVPTIYTSEIIGPAATDKLRQTDALILKSGNTSSNVPRLTVTTSSGVGVSALVKIENSRLVFPGSSELSLPTSASTVEGALWYNSGNVLYRDASAARTLLTTVNAFMQNGNSFGATAVLGTNDAQGLSFETNGTYRMTINTSGDVGIDTTSPSSKLHVNGNAEINGTLDMANNVVDNVTYLDIALGESYGVRFAGGSNSFAINMGDAAEFHYGPVTSWSIKMNMNSTADRGWTWGVDGLTPVAALSNVGDMQVAGNLYAMGNVGIGTDSPSNNLDINTSSNTSGISLDGKKALGGYSADVALRLNPSGDFAGVYIDQNRLTVADGIKVGTWSGSGPGAGNLHVDGVVGIGTTSPSQDLHVDGNMRLTGAFYDVNNEAGTSGQVLSATGSGVDWVNAAADTDWVISGSDMYSGISGNVGIGTTSPGYKLDIIGNMRATGRLYIEDIYDGSYYLDPDDANWSIYVAGNIACVGGMHVGSGGAVNDDDLIVDGNTGLGTSTPSQRLHVSGNMRLTGALYDANNETGTSGQVLSSTGSGVNWVEIPSQVSFLAYNSGDDVIAAGWHKVEFNVEEHDDGSNYSNTLDRFTAPANGVYHFSAHVGYSNVADGLRHVVTLYKNGSLYLYLSTGYANTSGSYQSYGGSVTMKLATNDYIEVFFYTADASAIIEGGLTYTHFSCHQVY